MDVIYKKDSFYLFLCFIFETVCLSRLLISPLLIASDYKAHVYKSFVGISIEDCKRECDNRQRCLSAIYRRKFLLCQLSTNIMQKEFSTETRHYLIGVYILNSTTHSCGFANCWEMDTCEVIRNETFCKIKECGKPKIPYTIRTLGNVFDVKSRIMLKDDTGGQDLTLQCNDYGEWNPYEFTRSIFDCSDGQTESGIYWHYIFGIPVYCDMDTDGGQWTVFQKRQDGSVDFYRNWEDYVTGFGNITGEFWMGLNIMHIILSTGPYEMRVDLEDFSGVQRYAKYKQFEIEGAEENFRLYLTGYSGTAGDSMYHAMNNSFSTKDADNDKSKARHCAQVFTGGWWYGSCILAHLNGKYSQNANVTERAKFIHWPHWHDFNISLKATEMKFRPSG